MTGDEQVAALYDILSQLDKTEMDTVHQHLEMSLGSALKGENQRRSGVVEAQAAPGKPTGCEDKISELLTQLASMRKVQPADPTVCVLQRFPLSFFCDIVRVFTYSPFSRKVEPDSTSSVQQDHFSAWKMTKVEASSSGIVVEQTEVGGLAGEYFYSITIAV